MWWAHLNAFYEHDAFAKDPIEAVELLIRGWDIFNHHRVAQCEFIRKAIIDGDIVVTEIDCGMCICCTDRDLIHRVDVKTICTDRPMFIPLVERLKTELEKYV
jgi:hypothetical protein